MARSLIYTLNFVVFFLLVNISIVAGGNEYIERFDRDLNISYSAKEISGLQDESVVFVFPGKITAPAYCMFLNYSDFINRKLPQISVFVNEEKLLLPPLLSKDGIYFYIPSFLLNREKNTVKCKPSQGIFLNLIGVSFFSLYDFEDRYFENIFSDMEKDSQPPVHPNQLKFDVLHHDISLDVDMTTDTVKGSEIITLKRTDPALLSVPLDFDDNGGKMLISGVWDTVSGNPLTFWQNFDEDRLYISIFTAEAHDEVFSLKIDWGGKPLNNRPDGNSQHYQVTKYDENPIAFSLSEPYRARVWYPCKDMPDDKFLSDMHITCPAEFEAFSNGNLISDTINPDQTRTFHWRETYPIATYLVSFICGIYKSENTVYTSLDGETTMTVAHYLHPSHFENEKNSVNGTVEVLTWLAETFGEYPFINEKYYNINHIGGSMEHQTCADIRPYAFIAPDYGCNRVNVHEAAHQWLGNKITVKNFDHAWTKEGFATYCEALWKEHKEGVAAYHTYVNNWRTEDWYPILSEYSDRFDDVIIYMKGAWVFHMLRKVIGDEAFFAGSKNYVTNPEYAYGNTDTDDLRVEYEKTYGGDLKWFFDEWLLRAERPEYQWKWSWHNESGLNITDIYIIQKQAGGAFKMPIEFDIKTLSGKTIRFNSMIDQVNQEVHFNIGDEIPSEVIFDPDNWVLDKNTLQEKSGRNMFIFF